MFYIFYKTVNLVNGNYYYGKHQTRNAYDGYLGSGLNLHKAIVKYGVDSFKRYDIFYAFSNDILGDMEKALVTESVISDPKSYNIALGGQGGNLGSEVNKIIGLKSSLYNKGKTKSTEHRKKLSESRLGTKRSKYVTEKIKATKKAWSDEKRDEFSKKMSELNKGNKNSFFGKKHTNESKRAIGYSKDHSGPNNPNYGNKHSDETKKKISETKKATSTSGNHPNARIITLCGVTYNSISECCHLTGYSKKKVYKMLNEEN